MSTILYTVIIYPLYTIIELAYTLIEKITSNSGIAVIGVSATITILCLPLYAVAEHWQEIERETERRLQPQVDLFKQIFKGDERYMITSAYYRENHYSPIMALRSSFSLLIQIPFFIAAYTFLSHLPDLQGESFLFIKDMGVPDASFYIGSFAVNILPIAMTAINIISGTVYTKGLPVKEKIQIYGMALIFLVILYQSPSGLVLYWTMNNVFGLIKNIFYKLQNPLKAFWLFVCAVATVLGLYTFIFIGIPLLYKLLVCTAVACIYLIPLGLRGVQKLLATRARLLVQDSKTRALIYMLSCVLLCLLSGLVIPSSLIASSPIEFANIGSQRSPVELLYYPTLQAIGLFVFWPLCVYFLFNHKVQTVLAIIMSCLCCSALVNTFIFSLSYGDISSSLQFINAVQFKTFSLVSITNLAIVAGLCILISLFIYIKRGKVYTYLIGILVLTLSLITIKNTSVISHEYKAFDKVHQSTLHTEITPIFTLSKTAPNVFVFMLDRAQGQYMSEILKESPDLHDSYSGFVFYNNTASFNGHTMIGSPGIYGGYEYTPQEMNKRSSELLVDKHNEALLLLPRLFTEQKGFSAVVTDPSWANYSLYSDFSLYEPYPNINAYQTIGTYSSLWHAEHADSGIIDGTETILKRNLLFFSIFRQAPVVLRESIYYKGRYWNSDTTLESSTIMVDNYAPLEYLPRLTAITDAPTGSYTCMVNELTHQSYFLQAPEFRPQAEVTNRGTSRFKDINDYATQVAAIKRIAEWLDYLKANGVYDNTRIILVSDHGTYDTEDDMEYNPELDAAIDGGESKGRGHFHCLLMYKDFNARGKVFEDNNTFMTNADVPALALQGLIDNPVNPFTQKKIPLDTTSLKKEGIIVTPCDDHQAWLYRKDTVFNIKDTQWWKVKDNIFKSENWSRP
ncbi:MAG: membrane protein insertase YidC [Treponema sp.]|nr:membrane protein insertase YidC [Treponema sp.]